MQDDTSTAGNYDVKFRVRLADDSSIVSDYTEVAILTFRILDPGVMGSCSGITYTTRPSYSDLVDLEYDFMNTHETRLLLFEI